MNEKDNMLQEIFNNLYEVHRMTYLLTYLNMPICVDSIRDDRYGFSEVVSLLDERISKMMGREDEINEIEDLSAVVVRIKSDLSAEIKRFNDDIDICDWDIYGSHRIFPNEAEMLKPIEKLLYKALFLAGGCCETEEDYLVELYDFNDYPMNFKTLEAAEAFLSRFDLVPYTVLERMSDGSGWAELYTE